MVIATFPYRPTRAFSNWMIIFAYYNVVSQPYAGRSLVTGNPMKPSNLSSPSLEFGNLDEAEAELLEKVADKLVRFAKLVGMTPEEMASLLNSGISIHELLAVVLSRRWGVA